MKIGTFELVEILPGNQALLLCSCSGRRSTVTCWWGVNNPGRFYATKCMWCEKVPPPEMIKLAKLMSL